MINPIVTLAKKYYPDKWNDSYIRILVERGKITADEYKEITGKDYVE